MPSLHEIIVETITERGPLRFDRFMELALYHPELGYYTRESAVIGRAGDFYTSPQVHPLFGALLGKQAEEIWHLLGEPQPFTIVEAGAGTGHLALDLLDYLRGRPCYAALDYRIVEIGPRLRARQQQLLAGHRQRLSWCERLSQLTPFSGLLLSNELLDAFPVRLVAQNDHLKEIYIAVQQGRLVEIRQPAPPELGAYFQEFSLSLPHDYVTEVNLELQGWLDQVSALMSSGFLLTIDYGYPAAEYYSPERRRGTLLGYHRHRLSADPLAFVGEQDLTAHVNFSALKRWGEAVGFTALGYCPQSVFLTALDPEQTMQQLYPAGAPPQELIRIKQLFMPQWLGETHKVMAQYKGSGRPALQGMSLRNHLDKL